MFGDYARVEALGLRVVLMLVETFGGLGPALVGVWAATSECAHVGTLREHLDSDRSVSYLFVTLPLRVYLQMRCLLQTRCELGCGDRHDWIKRHE